MAAAVALLVSGQARAAGFEVGENTTLSVARGGTGVVMKRDPSAMYFNPALLPRARGLQVLVDVNLLNLDLEMQRDPLVIERGSRTITREFEPVGNASGVFPAPFLAVSWDAGVEDFALAAGIFGPSAYGGSCFGERKGDDCVAPEGAARGMLIDSNLLEFYVGLGAGYQFALGGGRLALGASALAAHQRANFSLAIEADTSIGSPWEEDPEREAIFRARDLTSWRPTAIVGAAWERDGMRLGLSYRPPIRWESTGRAEVDLPQALDDLEARLSDEAVTFATWQAGSLRFGWGHEGGEHPGRPGRARYDLEFNVVWEDWSRVNYFEVVPKGSIELPGFADPDTGAIPEVPLYPIYQPKQYADTFSLRMGSSYGVNPWLTVHGGASVETAAQSKRYTNVDFVSWERLMGGAGATVHLGSGLDIELAYAHIVSPDRQVQNGEVYNQIPLSQCAGPSYEHPEACDEPGTPPGNPQNNGQWSTSFQMGSVGLSWHYD